MVQTYGGVGFCYNILSYIASIPARWGLTISLTKLSLSPMNCDHLLERFSVCDVATEVTAAAAGAAPAAVKAGWSYFGSKQSCKNMEKVIFLKFAGKKCGKNVFFLIPHTGTLNLLTCADRHTDTHTTHGHCDLETETVQ